MSKCKLPRYYRLSLYIMKKNFKIYIILSNIQYYITLRPLILYIYERKYIRSWKKPIRWHGAHWCWRKYCVDCWGSRWRERNLDPNIIDE